jgi:glycosyltransferase involved in cell wall biosynthesis
MMGPPLTAPEGESAHRRQICVVTETYPPEINGVAVTLARLVSGLRARGHEVSVVRPRQPVDGGDDADPDLTLVRGLALPGYSEVRIGWPAPAALGKSWATRRPDVLYVATEGPLGWSAMRIAARLSIPVFSGFHTNFHGYARHYHAGWLEPVVFRYLRRFHNRTRGTVVASVELRDQLRAAGFRNLSVIGRGVDQRLFTPARRSPALRQTWGASEDDLVVLYVGRLAPEKNLPLAIEAYRAMQRVTRSLRFVVVGDGPLRAALQHANPDLRFCGMQTGERLAAHYASADVFLFPSETETFGNVTLEALASGLVVVAYDYAAAHLHITHGETGVLVPCGEANTFVARSAALASSGAAFQRLRWRARESVVGVDWQRVVERFEAVLTADLDERSTATHATTGGPGERSATNGNCAVSRSASHGATVGAASGT